MPGSVGRPCSRTELAYFSCIICLFNQNLTFHFPPSGSPTFILFEAIYPKATPHWTLLYICISRQAGICGWGVLETVWLEVRRVSGQGSAPNEGTAGPLPTEHSPSGSPAPAQGSQETTGIQGSLCPAFLDQLPLTMKIQLSCVPSLKMPSSARANLSVF